MGVCCNSTTICNLCHAMQDPQLKVLAIQLTGNKLWTLLNTNWDYSHYSYWMVDCVGGSTDCYSIPLPTHKEKEDI